MYKTPFAVFATSVQPVPVLVIPCGPAVMLNLEATPDQEPIRKVPDDLVNLIQSPDAAENSTPLVAALLKLALLHVPPAILLVAALDATELATELRIELATELATELRIELATELATELRIELATELARELATADDLLELATELDVIAELVEL